MIFKIIKKILSSQKDKCIICKKATPYERQTHINKRKYYVETAGQLCEKCYYSIY